MDSSSVVLLLRVLLSLACVLGLLWFLGRRMAGTGAARRARQSAIAVVGRQSLGGKSGVVLVEVAGRRLLLGVGEQSVSLLTEIEPEPAEESRGRAAREEIDPTELAELERMLHDPDDDAPSSSDALSTPAARMPAVPTQRNPLEGSILSAATWRQAVVAVQERTLRR